MRRILLALLVAFALSPGILWRDGLPPPNHSQRLVLTPLAIPHGAAARIGTDGPVVTGAWHLSSPNTDFGSYSALVATGGNQLLAISDHGRFLRFPMPGTGRGAVALGPVLPGSDQFKPLQDMESATSDPATGRIWLGLEGRNAVLRLGADFSDPRMANPPQMHRWRSNGGPEALLRLADGRFVVLANRRFNGATRQERDWSSPAIRSTMARPRRSASSPRGYDPSDMAQLPDGRVLIVLRGLEFVPPGFAVRLVLADPAGIRAGEPWPWQDVGQLLPPLPIDNYEALAVTGGEQGGPLTLWLLSDDNDSLSLQRTLLLRFEWRVPARK